MLAPLPPRLRLLLSGLVWTVLLHGACEAFRMGSTVLVLFAGVVFATVVRWGRESNVGAGATTLAGALTKTAEKDEPFQREPIRTKVVALPFQRTLGARVKIWVSGLGLLACGLLWLVVATLLFLPDPAPESLHVNTNLDLLTVTLLLTVLFGVVLRSGLRGPADPLAPKESRTGPGDVLPFDEEENVGTDPRQPRGKKSHLRLVRPAP
ncbi:hypothetical protein [Archangium sp.]|jgi:hypothetical protein|uniref:hypothetical protein n=1 Tax=Archangium sp. TaxID=1872627 RepID=UPI002ED8C3D3